MKKNMFVISVATVVAICSLWNVDVRAQALTDQQKDKLEELERAAQKAALESELMALEAYAKLSPQERELRALEAELRAAEFEKIKEIITPREISPEERAIMMEKRKQALATKSMTIDLQTAVATAETEPSALFIEGGTQDLSFGSCGSDPNEFYNLPLFNAGSGTTWQTQNAPTTFYPWVLLTPNGNDASGRAAITSGNFSANFSSSPLFISITNNLDTYGVPLRHRLSFKYQFTKSNVNDVFRVQVGGNFFVTNLPTAGSWTRLTLDIPPFPRTTTTTEIRFTVFKNSASSSSPHGDLYAPQWCTEVRSTNVSLSIITTATTNFVSWSHEAAPTNFWSLEFSPVIGPGAVWSTNIGASPVVYSNTTAVVGFANNNAQRYYRLKRNW